VAIPTTKDEDAKRPQPRAPEPRRRANSDCQPASAPARNRPGRLKGDGRAFDPAACFLRLLTLAIEQLQQGALVDCKLLQRLTLDARHDAGNEPARQTHFDHRDQCAVLFQDDTGLVQDVRLGPPSVTGRERGSARSIPLSAPSFQRSVRWVAALCDSMRRNLRQLG